ncbi:hypothetical protein N656DRAFT_614664 [Canariomyces notabilis]|uniref:Uncharacterized protein n=1 Tax=Canariomyces notabilis TaxID=2074819 RepID=A0AAN6YUB5_9PEZI|nr:hypothetical protein N656DRAFT_614664 [Canariomyces arenarius]
MLISRSEVHVAKTFPVISHNYHVRITRTLNIELLSEGCQPYLSRRFGPVPAYSTYSRFRAYWDWLLCIRNCVPTELTSKLRRGPRISSRPNLSLRSNLVSTASALPLGSGSSRSDLSTLALSKYQIPCPSPRNSAPWPYTLDCRIQQQQGQLPCISPGCLPLTLVSKVPNAILLPSRHNFHICL